MRGFAIAERRSRSSRVKSSRSASPTRALEGLARREHARRSAEITIHSFGFAPGGARAHAREHPASIAMRGQFRVARPLHRPPNGALEQTSGSLNCGGSAATLI
jgi:hypothetical protein